METALTRGALVVAIDENGKVVATNNGVALNLYGSSIKSVDELIASGSQDNIKLAEKVKSLGRTHILGGVVSMTADEAAGVAAAINSHPANIAKDAKRAADLAELNEYYKTNDRIARGY